MYLSKLELHGFKSFATPTVLHFDPGITAIVGPNGCGKSNVVDAVRWVIGEQRARILRSEKMENVIFNGTSKRRPLGMAEVQLTIENTRGVLPTEYTEVTLGRRLYRSGESEYLLNNIPCRLKDVVDLFMDTGMGAGAYSVIELKMIEEILSDNAQDRRHLFEEAAGITKYKLRRTQALRKLDSTQADLTRLRDLTEEIEKRVHSLQRQAAKASRFREYEDALHHLEVTLAQVEYQRLSEQEQAIEIEAQHIRDELEEHTARLARDEADLTALRTALVAHEQALAEHQQRLRDHEAQVRSFEADVRLEQERHAHAGREQERMLREQEEAARQRETLQARMATLEENLGAARPARKDADGALREAEAARTDARRIAETQRQALHDLRRREQHLLEARAEHQRALDRLTNRLDLLAQERHRILEQAEALQTDHQAHQARLQEAQQEVNDARTAVDAAQRALTELEREHAAAQRHLQETTQTLQKREREHAAAAAEVQVLESLVASFDEFSDAVRFLASTPAWSPASLKTVADVLTCEDTYRLALDAALGDLGSCLVVETDQEAFQAAALLRSEHKGQATFLVLDRLRAASFSTNGSAAAHGLEAPALLEIVEVERDDLKPFVHLLLHHCYVAPTLEDAEALAERHAGIARFFALSGEWVDARGLVHAGSMTPDSSPVASRLTRRERLQSACAHLNDLNAEVMRATEDVSRMQAALDALPLTARRETVAQTKQALAEAEQHLAQRAYEQAAAVRQQTALTHRLTDLEADMKAQQARLDPLQAALAEAEDLLASLRSEREQAEEAFQEAEAASRAAQDRFNEATVAAVEARNWHESLLRDLDRTRHDAKLLSRRDEERREHLDTLQETIAAAQRQQTALQHQLDAIRTQRTSLEDEVAQARTTLLQTRVDIDTLEARLRKLRQAREQSIHEEHVRTVRRTELHTRKADLLAHVQEAFGLSLSETPVTVPDDFDERAAREEIQTLRGKIKNLGSVNALALEEYEAEKARFEFLSAQQHDLEHAEHTLLETIDAINTTAAERFQQTYEAIGASFRSLFSELFGEEASADLHLADANDPLESAIDIIARPRGKRPVSISQLSSGEKTLTAIALLFAIYLVKPSPFCILDEVDAPLDDANVDRFMRLLRRFAGDTQFILVTHNKRTMEMADRLYGITMQEQGVSRLVGVRFEEALELAG